jgi:hypothetical protein
MPGPVPLRNVSQRGFAIFVPARRAAGPFYREVRRRMRRIRFRVFTNVRTATRNLDLPLAIRESPIAFQPFPYGYRPITASVRRPHWRIFCGFDGPL